MDFLSQIFCCNIFSNSNKRKKIQIKDEELSIADFAESFSSNSTTSSGLSNSAMIFPSKTYRKDENDVGLNLTKEKILDIINYEFLESEDYKIFYNKEHLILSSKDSSFLTKNFPLIKMEYKIPKKEFDKDIGIEDIVNTLKDFKNRILWDENIKEMEIMEEFDNSFIIHTSYNKPIFFISERDIIEKKVDFYFNNKYYSYSSSVSDELNEKYKENEDVMRILNYISVYIIEEDEENFYFKSLNQLDYKMNIPNTLMNITLPMKIINWYKKLEKAVKK
jgi:hypothetical protein